MPVTILDIAKATGKSFSTVSRALSDSGRISEKTRNMIRETAHGMGYHPSFVGTALQKGRTGSIAVLLPEIGNPFYAEVMHHLQHYAAQDGLNIIVFDYDYDTFKERSYLEKMLAGVCDGMIAFLTSFDHTSPLISKLWQAHVPLVSIGLPDSDALPPCYDSVLVNNQEVMRQIFNCIAERGHRHIVKIEEPTTPHFVAVVKNMLQQVLADTDLSSRLTLDFHSIPPGSHSPVQDGMEAAKKIFQEHPETDVMIARDGQQFYGILAALRSINKRIPEDLLLITYDNTWITRYAPVPVLGIDQNLEQVVEHAYRMLKDRLFSRQWAPPRCEVVNSQLSNCHNL